MVSINHKFQFKMFKGQMLDFDKDRFGEVKCKLKDGDYEIVLRPQVKWDTEQMRKYFHGPVLAFLVENFKSIGHAFGKEQVRDWCKREFIGVNRQRIHGSVEIEITPSLANLDFEGYKNFLNGINAWCIENFSCELPLATEVE